MEKSTIIITGSKGLIGAELTKFLAVNHKIIELDYLLGHDLTNEEFVIDFFAKNRAEYLVNAFGMNDHVNESQNRSTNIFNISLEEINRYLKVNTIALFSVCREFAKNISAKSIINFASVYSMIAPNPALYEGKEKNIAYVISKSTVPNMTKHLAVHLAPGIRVNCIAPHGIENNQGESFQRNFNKRSPMKRLMKKDELNGLVGYLCSEQSTYMTGATLFIDGGWTSW
jgi:NAD(P)-dependent dehydrogenase (short-subunit alcohol dehydrogenase family)